MVDVFTEAQIPLRRLCDRLCDKAAQSTNHVADFYDLCLRLSPRESFGESRRNGIWAWATKWSNNCLAGSMVRKYSRSSGLVEPSLAVSRSTGIASDSRYCSSETAWLARSGRVATDTAASWLSGARHWKASQNTLTKLRSKSATLRLTVAVSGNSSAVTAIHYTASHRISLLPSNNNNNNNNNTLHRHLFPQLLSRQQARRVIKP